MYYPGGLNMICWCQIYRDDGGSIMTQEVDTRMKLRFDGYLPVVVDVETSGVDNRKHGLLEVAAVSVNYNDDGILAPVDSFSTHVTLFERAIVDPEALKINHIDPGHPFRFAVPESEALEALFSFVSAALKQTGCRRAVLVGHNAHFDLGFIVAAFHRCKMKKMPFHHFTVFDTATLAGAFYGKTVLAKALKKAGIEFDIDQAHGALYDTQKTAEIFCAMINAADNKKGM